MLKFSMVGKSGKPVYFLGLCQANLDRLKDDQPIAVHLGDLGGPPVDVVLVYGPTERALFDRLQGIGVIPAEVEYREAELGTAEVIRIRRQRGED